MLSERERELLLDAYADHMHEERQTGKTWFCYLGDILVAALTGVTCCDVAGSLTAATSIIVRNRK
jgi:hypothetical protein